MIFFRYTCLALALAFVAGCNSKGDITGTVKFDGTPVDGGSISFIPDGGTGNPASGSIKDGKYTINGERRPVPGKYKVEILWNKTTGKQVPNKSDPGTTMDETNQVIPNRYNSQSELTAEVKSGSNTFDYDLKPGPVDSKGKDTNGKVKAVGD